MWGLSILLSGYRSSLPVIQDNAGMDDLLEGGLTREKIMKPVANISKYFFPMVGDILELLVCTSGAALRGAAHGQRYKVIEIQHCSRQTLGDCKQDLNCIYCLKLEEVDGQREYHAASHHCWRDCIGQPYWKIIEEK